MSQSGQQPGAAWSCQSSQRWNMAFSKRQSSQKSSVMRHMLACF